MKTTLTIIVLCSFIVGFLAYDLPLLKCLGLLTAYVVATFASFFEGAYTFYYAIGGKR